MASSEFINSGFVRYLTRLHEARRATKPKIVGDQIFVNPSHPDHPACTEGTTEGMPTCTISERSKFIIAARGRSICGGNMESSIEEYTRDP